MTSPLDDALAAIATTNETLERLARLGERDTAGPAVPLGAIDAPHPPAPRWTDGWWDGARRVPAHVGRVGGAIRPFATVVHTTDMLPGELKALVNAWTTRAGEGACAHFLIGRDVQDGVVQFVPITRNGNHAGGPGHGVFAATHVGGNSATPLHPNVVSVGIEVHCAGGVRLMGGEWRLVEDGLAHGAPLPASDVIPDPQRPGRGWHVVTDYQREQLAILLADLELVLAPLPASCTTKAFGEVPAPFTVLPSARVVTHAQLDPVHRADPWQPTCEWLAKR